MKLRIIAVSLLALTPLAQAKILTLNYVNTSSMGLGAIQNTSTSVETGTQGSTYYSYDLTSSQKTEIQKQPTKTEAGLSYTYNVTNGTTSTTTTKYDYDVLSIDNATGSSSINGGKYITFEGSITSLENTNLSFTVAGSGSFKPIITTNPFNGSTATQLPNLLNSIYVGTSLSSLEQAMTSKTEINYGNMYSNQTNSSVFLQAGKATSFAVAMFVPQNASIENFSLFGTTGYYNIRSNTETNPYNSKTLISANVLAPVPEPETYALMGMGLVGLIAARRRKVKAA